MFKIKIFYVSENTQLSEVIIRNNNSQKKTITLSGRSGLPTAKTLYGNPICGAARPRPRCLIRLYIITSAMYIGSAGGFSKLKYRHTLRRLAWSCFYNITIHCF